MIESEPVPASTSRRRLDSIDMVRGLVMVLMALDHTRDFFGSSAMEPRDVSDAGLFVTRWVTHFCAPVFVFLAGASAHLYGRKRGLAELRRFLATRGLWLVVLELTVVRVAWTFDVVPGFLPMQVIWAIGWAMIALSALVSLPVGWVATIGIATIAGHDLLRLVDASALGIPAALWTVLHGYGPLPAQGAARPFVAYALIPWTGVIAAGFGFGQLVAGDPGKRRRRFLRLGAALIGGFVVLRAINGYGDPTPWSVHASLGETVLSFLNCEKYPPSLAFLLMTLGPAIVLLGVVDGVRHRLAQPFVMIGRVPLLYYVAHIFLIHLGALALTALAGGPTATLLDGFHPMSKPDDFGISLPMIYLVWVAVVLSLYPLSVWFANLKARRGDWWLSYL